MFSLDWPEVVAATGALATILGALVSGLGSMKRSEKLNYEEVEHVQRRLADVRSLIENHKRIERVNRWSSGLLTFSQYIVGGVLATSFVQQNLSSQLVGFLGVVVLVASLINERFKPDQRVTDARARIYQLNALIREAEDNLHRISSTLEPESPELVRLKVDLSQYISEGLNRIELLDFAGPSALIEVEKTTTVRQANN